LGIQLIICGKEAPFTSLCSTQGYDQDYELISISATTGGATIQNLSYGSYDADGNILAITDNLTSARTQAFTYDDLNRVGTASGLYGSQSYTYDGVGNRLTATLAGTLSTYTPATASNQIATIVTGSNTRSFGYLASGQVSGDQRTPSSDYTLQYDDIGRMNTSKLNGTTLATYTYNGFEQRVIKTVGTTITDFIFDRFGHLLAEANGSTGAMLREYIWLDDKPIAMVDDTGTSPVIYYIHTDHLGTPQKITDGTATIVWDGAFDPFGNPANAPGTLTNNLRFPGQYFDSETQLSQNWHRDYDPTIGRYVESDPIGLGGGINTYAYVLNDPVELVDPFGLCRTEVDPFVRTTVAGFLVGRAAVPFFFYHHQAAIAAAAVGMWTTPFALSKRSVMSTAFSPRGPIVPSRHTLIGVL